MSQPLVPNLGPFSWLVLEQRKPDRDLAITDVVRHGGNAAALAVAEIRAEVAETERAVAHRIDVHAMPDTQPRGVFVDLLEQREQADTENPKEVLALRRGWHFGDPVPFPSRVVHLGHFASDELDEILSVEQGSRDRGGMERHELLTDPLGWRPQEGRRV